MLLKYFRIRRLRLPLLALLALNISWFTYYHVKQSLTPSDIEMLNIDLDSTDPLAEISTTNANYAEAVEELIANIPSSVIDMNYNIPKTDKEPIFQDPRLTYGLILNLLNKDPSVTSIPFHWADWVDLSLLNHQMNKPFEERLKCKDMIPQINLQSDDDKEKCTNDPRYFGCIDTKDLTSQELKQYGVNSHEELPGFIQFEHTVFSSNEFVRNIQAKTYVLAHMPLPYKVVFLNDYGDDIILDVHKGKIDSLLEDYHQSSINPLSEFEKLRSPSAYLSPYSPEPIIQMTSDMFNYTRLELINAADKMRQRSNLNKLEQSYLYSMLASIKSRYPEDTEEPYFREATLRVDSENSDSGWHYDWRFFNGKLKKKARTAVILERLLRNWFKFTEKYGIVSWIAHGPLLSWYWNGAVFPYDNDLDVQMPIRHLTKLGQLYNQTLVVEDLHEGVGKYLIDVGTYIHNRDISRNENHIDARFIDVDSGVYIDITGLAIGETKRFSRAKQTSNIHDRRKHYYQIDDLVPLKLSMLNGVPYYINNKVVGNLHQEYRSGIRRKTYQDYYFSGKLNIWIHFETAKKVFEANDYQKHNGILNKLKMRKLIDEMTDDKVFEMFNNDHELAMEYRLASSVHEFHMKELEYLIHPINRYRVEDKTELTDEYKEFLKKNVKLHEPFRESLFQYERINGGLDEFYARAYRELDRIEVSE
ncbi:Protein MNN4 [Candida tropicalis]